MLSLTSDELAIFKKLNTPQKIQDFLDTLPCSFDINNDTQMSPRRVLQERKAHCFEGALFAAAAMWVNGNEPLLMSLSVDDEDWPHALTLFKQNGHWGAISKTNHIVLRYRDPIYRTLCELALSYFHEYFLVSTGKKTLKGYSRPINLKRFGTDWVTSEDDLHDISYAILDMHHTSLIPHGSHAFIRKATPFERKIADIPEWEG